MAKNESKIHGKADEREDVELSYEHLEQPDSDEPDREEYDLVTCEICGKGTYIGECCQEVQK